MTEFYVKGGTLRHDARCYVERAADRQLFELLQTGEFCYVLTSRQMGKSSLMVRTAWRLRQAGISLAVIDLTSIGQNLPPEQWYDGLLGRLGSYLGCEDELEEFWKRRTQGGPLQRWLEAIQEVVLKPRLAELRRKNEEIAGATTERSQPWSGVVLFIDELDVVRSLPFATDEFFAAIRDCFNRRAVDPEFGLLNFCLLGVASPSDLIRDPRRTPFNIGHRIELSSFTEKEAQPLALGLGREEKMAQALLNRILYWTSGHPYLTQVLCGAAAADDKATGPAGVDRLCESLFLSQAARDRDDNLIFVREWILRSQTDRASLLGLYGDVLAGQRVPFDRTSEAVEVLRLSGVVQVVDGCLRIRNRIYYRVFDSNWLAAHKPGDREASENVIFRRGFRRGILVASGIFGLLFAIALGLFFAGRLGARYSELDKAQSHVAWRQPLWIGRAIPNRPATATGKQIDLSTRYNGLIAGPWHGVSEDSQMGSFAGRLVQMAGVFFDIRGVVQLAGEPQETRELPQDLVDVRIAQRFGSLHLIQACSRRGMNGRAIAALILHYSNGNKIEFPIIYGEHVSSWWASSRDNPASERLVEAWVGPNSFSKSSSGRPRLFKSTWVNPYPEQVVSFVEITSKLAGPALLVFAITVE